MRREPAGFTLLEVVVMLAVLGLLLLGLAQGTRLGLRSWHAQAEIVGTTAELDMVDRTLRLLIAGIDPISARAGRFAGGPHGMSFATRLPSGRADPIRAVDAVLAVDGAHRLVLRWTPRMRPAPGIVLRPEQAELLAGVGRLELSYWRVDAGGHGSWVDRWSGPDIPGLVRLRLMFRPPDRRHWPDIVAATMLEVPQ